MVEDADRLIATVDGAGVPDVAQGQAIAEVVVGASRSIKKVLSDARDQVDQLPETPEELDRASNEDPACRSLSAAPGKRQ